MNQEAAFLAAIRANPKDRAPRLIYADWLEERGDSRGELVQLEEEMRQLPVFADRYWQLKKRLNELRLQVPAEWLERMRYGTDREPVFTHGVPDGWKERWRLIREFTERWHRIAMGDVGGRAEEIEAAESKLGRRLSPSVREWVAFAHDVRRGPDSHDFLRDLYQMQELEGHSAVSLLLQCEGDYHWAVRHADLDRTDPPIYGFHWDFENQDEQTFVPDDNNPIADTLTWFALEYVMSYTHGDAGGFNTEVGDPTDLIRDLTATFPVQSRFGKTLLFEADNLLVRLSSSWWTPDPEDHLIVEAARPLTREDIPAFLWDYTRNGGAFRGLFTPNRRR